MDYRIAKKGRKPSPGNYWQAYKDLLKRERKAKRKRKLKQQKTQVPRRSIVNETIWAMVEVARLFPNQDAIRLAAGVIDFNLPLDTTLRILRALAPFYQKDADMIRLAAGFNELKKKILFERLGKQA